MARCIVVLSNPESQQNLEEEQRCDFHFHDSEDDETRCRQAFETSSEMGTDDEDYPEEEDDDEEYFRNPRYLEHD